MSTFNSSVYGPLPLSIRGKQLMRELREATFRHTREDSVQSAIALSEARGELVKYIGKLEALVQPKPDVAITMWGGGGGGGGKTDRDEWIRQQRMESRRTAAREQAAREYVNVEQMREEMTALLREDMMARMGIA